MQHFDADGNFIETLPEAEEQKVLSSETDESRGINVIYTYKESPNLDSKL